MRKIMAKSIYKTFVGPTKIPWRFWKDIYYVLQMIEKNYTFKPKSGCWRGFVNFENDRFIDDIGDIESFESVDSFDLHPLFGEIASDKFVEGKKCSNLVKKEDKSDLVCKEKEIIIEKIIGLDSSQHYRKIFDFDRYGFHWNSKKFCTKRVD